MQSTVENFTAFYAAKGWRIFPCQPNGKTPLVKWADEATTDRAKIKDWWEQYPTANIGLATGATSGVFALDVDAGHGGVETLSTLVEQHSPLPKTPKSNTGGGGNHYLFAWESGMDIRNSAGKLGAGLDTRGNGGYIVVPHSKHPNGKYYEWDEDHKPSVTSVSRAPVWLLQMLEKKADLATPQQATNGAYIAGQRNSALTSLAGSMRRRGMDEESIFVALNVENLNKCVPPLSESEIRIIAKSVMRYDPTAAPELQPRDRVTAEWAFAKTVFEVPAYLFEFSGITPDVFSVRQLAEFWSEVSQGVGVGLAAANCEILADLENYKDWDFSRVDTYANIIKRYAHLDRAAKLGWKLQQAAQAGDVEAIDAAILKINQDISLQDSGRIVSIASAADAVEAEVHERVKNPTKVWGIPYAWEYLSELTGGKQPGELIMLAGEPKVGKSWWAFQDALETAIEYKKPVYIWSGEMGANQVTRRAYQLLGVNGENMRTGFMTDGDWEALKVARELILNSPLYIDDAPLRLQELRGVLQHEKDEHGIEHFVLDYAFLIDAPGKDEIEKTNNVSRTLKQICRELCLSGLLITSVNKGGMDTEKFTKSNIRGSGQQPHDADVLYGLTKFAPIENDMVRLRFNPKQYDNLITLHIAAGREFNPKMTGGVLHFSRIDGTPKFKAEPQERKYS